LKEVDYKDTSMAAPAGNTLLPSAAPAARSITAKQTSWPYSKKMYAMQNCNLNLNGVHFCTSYGSSLPTLLLHISWLSQ
jgi:hypothetical protein